MKRKSIPLVRTLARWARKPFPVYHDPYDGNRGLQHSLARVGVIRDPLGPGQEDEVRHLTGGEGSQVPWLSQSNRGLAGHHCQDFLGGYIRIVPMDMAGLVEQIQVRIGSQAIRSQADADTTAEPLVQRIRGVAKGCVSSGAKHHGVGTGQRAWRQVIGMDPHHRRPLRGS
jgi:hypothetical protein